MADTTTAESPVRVTAGGVPLEGALVIPEGAEGVVLFAHGSGSGRHSPRNRFVARRLEAAGLATLLIDLLTEAEERAEVYTRHLRFDIGLLAGRLAGATDWLAADPARRHWMDTTSTVRLAPVGDWKSTRSPGLAPTSASPRGEPGLMMSCSTPRSSTEPKK